VSGKRPRGGRSKGEISADRWKRVWWYTRQEYSFHLIARQLGVDEKTVRYYVLKASRPMTPLYDLTQMPADAYDRRVYRGSKNEGKSPF
jgi:hypothetical protein